MAMPVAQGNSVTEDTSLRPARCRASSTKKVATLYSSEDPAACKPSHSIKQFDGWIDGTKQTNESVHGFIND